MKRARREPPGTTLVARLEAARPSPSPNEKFLLERLRELSERVSKGCLQLAVVGQFKRGKSTLINALIGDELLPSGILPVTAIPTFIDLGEPSLTINYADGRIEASAPSDADEMNVALHHFVSENGNPGNQLNVRDVRVTWNSDLLRSGVTIIDTPGVGSTLEHNSRAAEAALPEADVALFILSPDPPVTRVEAEYLADIEAHAAQTIILLTKCDLVSEQERTEAAGFIHKVLGIPRDEILCISARAAIEARRRRDDRGWEESGFVELQSRLAEFMLKEKQPALDQAFAKKAARLLGELQLESEVVLRALELPVEELATRASQLSTALIGIDAERARADDLLTGDRKRAIAELRAEAERIAERARFSLLPELTRRVENGESPDRLAQELLDRLPPMFAVEFQTVRDWLSDRLHELLKGHAAETERLVAAIRSAAAAALSMEIAGPASAVSAEFDLAPVWYARRVETLIPVPNRAIERLLPARLRHKRAIARIGRELELAINRNVEALRWSLIQASEQLFRRFAHETQETLNVAEAATREAVSTVLARRRRQSSAAAGEIEQRGRFLRVLETAMQRIADQPLAGTGPQIFEEI